VELQQTVAACGCITTFDMQRKEVTMRRALHFSLLAILGISLAIWPSLSDADDWNRLTTAIFNHPVQIPGKVLPAGIYVFRLADISGERNVVQVWNADQTEIVATVMGFPEYLDTAPQTDLFIFEEQGKGLPPLLKSWFQIGNRNGERFIYSKEHEN
jgi:hypothetical protein